MTLTWFEWWNAKQILLGGFYVERFALKTITLPRTILPASCDYTNPLTNRIEPYEKKWSADSFYKARINYDARPIILSIYCVQSFITILLIEWLTFKMINTKSESWSYSQLNSFKTYLSQNEREKKHFLQNTIVFTNGKKKNSKYSQQRNHIWSGVYDSMKSNQDLQLDQSRMRKCEK